jgi:serine/threonine kinase PknH
MPCQAVMVQAWPQPLPGRAARSRRVWALVGVAVAVIALAAVVVLVATIHSGGAADRIVTTSGLSKRPKLIPPPPLPRAPPARPVPDEALPGLLLDPPTVNAIMGTRGLVVNPKLTSAKLYIDNTDKPECGGVWANANRGVYPGSAWEAVQTQYLREQDNPQHEVYQSVVSFPTAQTASGFVAKEANRWPLCKGKTLTTTNPETPAQTWWIATVGTGGDVLTSVSNREGARGYSCQHGLTSRNNVVVDVEACGWDVTQQGTTIAQRIAEQISRTL